MTSKASKSCWAMEPGYGSECLRLGQTEPDVRAFLGKPKSITRKYEGQYFYNYPELGLEVDFGVKGGTVAYLFFFREGFRGNRQGEMQTIHGLRPGDTKEKVLQLLGRPTSESDAVDLNMGGCVDAWFQYESGINFQFDQAGTVNMITIAPAST